MQSDTQIADTAPRGDGTPAPPETPQPASTDRLHRPADDLVEADLLVEDVSIDGMCGVY